MNVNPKTVRRVMVLIAGAVLIVAVCAGVYLVRQRQIAAKYAGYRDAGLAAFAAGDYAAALQHLKPYIGKYRSDGDALFAYATSRSRVEEPDARHLTEGIKAFQMLAELEPGSPRVGKALLEQYTKAYYHTEAIDLADKVLARDPNDVLALRTKALALERMRKFDEAIVVAERLNDVAPKNLDGQLLTYRLYLRTDKPATQIIARAEAMRAKYPDDPRFELLLAIAYGQSGDVEKARALLRAAAQRTPPDEQFVRQLSMVLDRNRMFADSQALLERAVAQNPDPELRAILVQRLWQNGQAKEAAERVKDVDPASSTSDSQLLALRALALFALERREEAQRIVAALGARKNDASALAWSEALATRFATPPPDPRAAIASYRAALTRDPHNGIIRYMVGEAYERLGESEPALAAWRVAAELVPSWSKPAEKIARALAATGRTEEAIHHALLALRSAPPGDIGPEITYAVVAFKHLGQSNDPVRLSELLEHVESIQQQAPREPETLPIHIALLARTGKRDAAIQTARAALAAEDRPAAMTLLRLSSVSRGENLGLESEINALLEQSTEPITPKLALARASEMSAAGDPAQGLKLLEEHAGHNAGGDRAAQWQLALAQFREQTKDPKAAEAWLSLGEAYPNDIAVQTAILRSAPSARHNRPFIERTIDRVKNLTGEEGTLWKIERARWLLGSDREKDHSDAVNILAELVRVSPTLVEPRLLLAAALEKIDNTSGAIKELRVAAEQQRGSSAIATELARLLQAQGKFEDARVYLDRAAKDDTLDAATRRHVAAMFAHQGDLQRAVTFLRDSAKQNALDSAGLLLLAELQRRQGLAAEAEAVYQDLLARTPLELETIESAADFYASQGKLDEARTTLKKIESMQTPPGAGELAAARFAERHETPAMATAHYAAATTAAPADVQTWRERIGYLMRAARAGEAVAVADEALRVLPNDPALQSLKAYAAASANVASGEPDLQPLIDDLSRDPANTRSLATAQLLQEEAAGRLSKPDAAARFRQLADRFPRHKPLQVEAVRRTLAAGEMVRATELAVRTMQAFPGDADVARLATNVFRQSRDWKQMESAAQQWRARALDHPAEADVAIAEARLARGDAAGAAKQLEPHVKAATASPDSHAILLITYARALAAAGREEHARELLEPLLPSSPRWRAAWMNIAESDVTEADAAAAWLERIAPRVVSGAETERLTLARAWHGVGSRFALPGAHEEAKKILAPLCEQPDAGADTFLLLASALQATGDVSSAETNYRRALAMRPESTTALNNLAYLLLMRGAGTDLAEAQSLAGDAVALSPDVASFHDTLARARFKAGDRDGALKSFQRALDLEPDNVEAMIGKATVLWAQGDRAAVRALLQQIDATLPRKPRLPAELKQELELTRTQANAAFDPG
ncbi:MAG TPA: tetratricopeptide repeat protein [Tepidisphaeraceae bacterium]|nr:tetratricopeptide repeat protein [Tepidisphaeraceae bacterium]